MSKFYETYDGYCVYTSGPNRGLYVHKVLCEEALGRPLNAGERIHHRNHNRADNSCSNLWIMRASDHSLVHAVGLEVALQRLKKRGVIYERLSANGPYRYTFRE